MSGGTGWGSDFLPPPVTFCSRQVLWREPTWDRYSIVDARALVLEVSQN
jgi:hypothetical protein